MISDIFWTVVTSKPALWLDTLLLLAALIVGFFPLIKFIPVIGPYVEPSRFAALLIALSICFLLGFRVSHERQTAAILRVTLAAKQADLENARKSLADENQRAKQIEAAADAQHQSDTQYIASLQARPACALDDGDLRNLRGLRQHAPSGRP